MKQWVESFSLLLPSTEALGRILPVLPQTPAGVAALPADPPIGGPVWTVLLPTLLLVGSFVGTYLLYRRFSREEGEE